MSKSEKIIVLTVRQEAIKEPEIFLKLEKNNLNHQNLCRNWAVLALLYSTKKRKAKETQTQWQNILPEILTMEYILQYKLYHGRING